MNEYEKNVYTNLFEYPTKHIVKLELENEEKDKEIERLNNIINELEKYICQEWYCFDNESIEFEVSKNILDKLKELKESGNNE